MKHLLHVSLDTSSSRVEDNKERHFLNGENDFLANFKFSFSPTTPYTVSLDPLVSNRYIMTIRNGESIVEEVYSDSAAALIRADNLRHGVKSDKWIIDCRLDTKKYVLSERNIIKTNHAISVPWS